jgi:tetratricopeptide (TPR) repeat protein
MLLGRLCAEMGNSAYGIQIFEELAKADPNDTEALAAAAELHKEAGSIEKALRTADALVNLQGKRGTADDLSELNKSLEFYENAVNAYSSSVKEMWDKNIKLLSGAGEAADEEEAGMDLLLGSAGMAQAVDEESEALFIEDSEEFDEDELVDEDFFSEEEPFSEILEAWESPGSLDDMAEPGAMPQFPQVPPSGRGAPQASLPETPAPPPENSAPHPAAPASQAPPPPLQSPPLPPPPQSPPQSPPPPELKEQRPAEPAASPLEPELPPPGPEEDASLSGEPELPPQEESFPEAEETESSDEESTEENPDDEALFPEDTTLELSPDEEESIFSDEIPENPAVLESEDDLLDLEPGLPPPEEFTPEETLPEDQPVFEEGPVFENEPALEEEPDAEDEVILEESGAADEPDLGEKPAAGDGTVPEELAAEDEPLVKEGTSIREDSSGSKPGKPLDAENIAKLLSHLKALIRELPDKNVEQFLNSDVRLSLEFLIDVLQGRKGLYKDIKERLGEEQETPESGDSAGTPPSAQVAGTLAYLERLASVLPDQTLSTAITRKTDAVIAEITQSGKIKTSIEKDGERLKL